jgi:hypothetical protein
MSNAGISDVHLNFVPLILKVEFFRRDPVCGRLKKLPRRNKERARGKTKLSSVRNEQKAGILPKTE